MGMAGASSVYARRCSGLHVLLEVEGPTNLGHGVADPGERFAIGDFMPDVEDAGFVHRIFHLDDLRAELFVAPSAGLLADLLAYSSKQLCRLCGRGV